MSELSVPLCHSSEWSVTVNGDSTLILPSGCVRQSSPRREDQNYSIIPTLESPPLVMGGGCWVECSAVQCSAGCQLGSLLCAPCGSCLPCRGGRGVVLRGEKGMMYIGLGGERVVALLLYGAVQGESGRRKGSHAHTQTHLSVSECMHMYIYVYVCVWHTI